MESIVLHTPLMKGAKYEVDGGFTCWLMLENSRQILKQKTNVARQ